MVALIDDVVCIKICGRANFTSSVDFKNLVTELANRGYERFVLDLSECILMDSTFLGVLAGIGLKFCESEKPDGSKSVELLNPNDRLSDLLENLGVAHLFKITQAISPAAGKYESLPSDGTTETDRLEVTRTCLEAHQTLMQINPDNIKKFKDVAQFLAEDLKRLEEKKTSG